MNVTAHQGKKKEEKTKTVINKAGEGRKQATDVIEAVCPLRLSSQKKYVRLLSTLAYN